MAEMDQDWMEYIDGEVRAACAAKGWGHQIRRKWSVREKPVSQSSVDDYEWKLLPGADGKLPDAPPDDFDGAYYVLCFDKSNGRFLLQHDTHHMSIMGPDWETATYTEIQPDPDLTPVFRGGSGAHAERPPVGWLRDHLLGLTSRFGANDFSCT